VNRYSIPTSSLQLCEARREPPPQFYWPHVHITMVATAALALEYEAVCSRAEHRVASGLAGREVDVFIDTVIAMVEPVETHYLWKPQLRDPNDEMVLEAAINGRADALVTFNVRDYGDAPSRFGVEVLLPRQAIIRIRQ
jgi:predicted nucleic acid-binding protein